MAVSEFLLNFVSAGREMGFGTKSILIELSQQNSFHTILAWMTEKLWTRLQTIFHAAKFSFNQIQKNNNLVIAKNIILTHWSRCFCSPYSSMALSGVSGCGFSSNPTIWLILLQCLSLMPGLQKVWSRGRCSLNWSNFILKSSVDLLGLGLSERVLESLCMVRHIVPTSSSTSSASRSRKGPN